MAEAKGFFTDTSICIGCKACEVACKEWNQLQGDTPTFLADSYDNTGKLDAQNWRHVKFIEPENRLLASTTVGNGQAWLMMSDVCKHCAQASCAEVCPTNAIIRTEFDTVFIQQDTCNGCRNCISACPYGVPTGESAVLPSHNDLGGYLGSLVAAALAVVGGLIAFRRRRQPDGTGGREPAPAPPAGGGEAG